jgi:enoyl-CoA hydratase/carnithine racemase
MGLADGCVDSARLPLLWETLATTPFESSEAIEHWVATHFIAKSGHSTLGMAEIDAYFGLENVPAIIQALEAAPGDWAKGTAAVLRKRSPLMLHVVLEQIRRARAMGLADDLRMERDLVRHCFNTVHLGRRGASSETTEGVRALAVDKDHSPKWNPPRIEDVTPEMVAPFFVSPWPAHAHPLRALL